MFKNLNVWFFLSLTISLFVLIPILTVFSSHWLFVGHFMSLSILLKVFRINYFKRKEIFQMIVPHSIKIGVA